MPLMATQRSSFSAAPGLHGVQPYLLNVGEVRERQRKRSHSHGPAVPKGAATVELVPGGLVDVAELRGRQLLQHLDHPRPVAPARSQTVLLSEPAEGESTFTVRWQRCITFKSRTFILKRETTVTFSVNVILERLHFANFKLGVQHW